MSRGSFGRSVARAAASGGSRSYRARPPILWYAAMVVIIVAGIGLAAYSRNERLHPATIGPTASDNWQVALAIDICGTLQANLPANSNLTSVGIRTFGNGLINVDPGAVTTGASAYEGVHATLGKFASSYPSFTLTSTSIKLPTKSSKTWANGESCTGPLKGAGTLEAKVWSSPTATGHIVTGDLTKLHLSNGEMITVAFVPKGASIPEPPSRSALLAALGTGSSSSTSTPASTTTTPKNG
ncbi:MAG: hypothetical protein JWO62_781 [Acidimicrobiaceae bacterium]|jgi:hypothetical protein|nr:hypothetical protein [Acidimicrobiaceae bacterium]